MNTDNLTDQEIAQYLKERIEDDDFDGFRQAAMDVTRDPDRMSIRKFLRRVGSKMIRDDEVTMEQYDRLNTFQWDLLDLMDAEIDDLEAELREARG